MTYAKGTILFAGTPDDEVTRQAAKDYIEREGFTLHESVKLVRRKEGDNQAQTIVEAL